MFRSECLGARGRARGDICLCGHLERASGTGFLTGPCYCTHIYVSMMHVELMFLRLLFASLTSAVHRSVIALEGVMYLARC